MSKNHELQRAFFLSLLEHNAAPDALSVQKVGLLAAIIGTPSLRHLHRYYPECARS